MSWWRIGGIAQESHFVAEKTQKYKKKKKKTKDILWLAPTAYGLGTSKNLLVINTNNGFQWKTPNRKPLSQSRL